MEIECQRLADEYGLEYLGFLSLTFLAADELDRPKFIKEAQRRFTFTDELVEVLVSRGDCGLGAAQGWDNLFPRVVVCDEDIDKWI